MNIANAYEDHRFDQSVDDGSNFKHRTILCMAIKNSSGQIIGVIQLINKFDSLVSIIALQFFFHSLNHLLEKLSWQREWIILMLFSFSFQTDIYKER